MMALFAPSSSKLHEPKAKGRERERRKVEKTTFCAV
jgi:hypothetical protein